MNIEQFSSSVKAFLKQQQIFEPVRLSWLSNNKGVLLLAAVLTIGEWSVVCTVYKVCFFLTCLLCFACLCYHMGCLVLVEVKQYGLPVLLG